MFLRRQAKACRGTDAHKFQEQVRNLKMGMKTRVRKEVAAWPEDWEQIDKEQGRSGTVGTSDKVAPVTWLLFHE